MVNVRKVLLDLDMYLEQRFFLNRIVGALSQTRHPTRTTLDSPWSNPRR